MREAKRGIKGNESAEKGTTKGNREEKISKKELRGKRHLEVIRNKRGSKRDERGIKDDGRR